MNRWQDWWRQAQRDLQTAGHLLAAGDFEWACFTSQQAAEKSLKAVLEQRNADHEGHSLNRRYMPTRYHDAVPESAPADQFIQRDAENAIQDARLVIDFVGGLVGPAPP